MFRVQLTEEELEELHRRTRVAGLAPRTRDRLEMVRLAAAGWPVARIAPHLRVSPRRVRFWLRQYLDHGFDALPDQPHPGRPGRLTPALVAAVQALLDRGDRTWTLGQLAAWLETEHQLSFSNNHLSTLLRRARLSCRRTERDLGHKQDPQAVAIQQADLETLEKGGWPGTSTSATSTRSASP